MKLRLLINILLVPSILFFPWWVSLALGVLLLVKDRAYEVIVWAFVFDTLYGTAYIPFFGLQFIATLLFFILFFLSIAVKRRIILYRTV